jgi:hypothetical protein
MDSRTAPELTVKRSITADAFLQALPHAIVAAVAADVTLMRHFKYILAGLINPEADES